MFIADRPHGEGNIYIPRRPRSTSQGSVCPYMNIGGISVYVHLYIIACVCVNVLFAHFCFYMMYNMHQFTRNILCVDCARSRKKELISVFG